MPLSEWLLTAPGAISIGALTTRPLTPGPARPSPPPLRRTFGTAWTARGDRPELSGELPLPPIDHLTGLRPLAASAGATTFAMPATAWLCARPPGRALGGAVALLAETALSTAIQTMQPAATAVAPIDLKVNNLWATEA